MSVVLVLGIMTHMIIIGTAGAQSDGDSLTTFSSTFFAGSGDCSSCHTAITDSAGDDVSFDSNWRASTMANAARDPLWQAKVESEILRTPALQGAIEHKCITCHMPMAHTQAPSDGIPIAMFGSGFLNPANDLHEAAMDGVSCALCHQISAENLGEASTFSGHFPIDTTTTKDRLIFGKYYDPSVNKMSGNFIAVGGAQVEDSALCATCHTLYTSAVDAEGTPIVGGENFPEQTPYQEWEHSVFGDGNFPDTSCQDCHMPAISGTAKLTKRGSTPDRSGFGKHFYTGGNSFILAILRDNGAELGVTASSAQYDEAIDRSEAMLAQETGIVTIEAARVEGTEIKAKIRVNNLTGHKFPTGIPLRRSWIHLTMAEDDEPALFESGKPLANGDISGNDADVDQTLYEPHYDVISTGDQVQIYEAIMGDDADKLTYTLLRATGYLKDNRLLPEGFDKSSAPGDIAVQGAARDDADFMGGMDDVFYQSPVTGEHGLVTISADLLYQTVSSAFIKDLGQDSGAGEHVSRFAGYYDAADKTPDYVAGAAGVMEYKLLHAGWNMISGIVNSRDSDLDDIFAPILDDLVLVKNGSGQVYWPAYGIDDIGQWQIDEAYQIYMETDGYLSMFGMQVVPEETPIALAAGWNMAAYLRDTAMAVNQALTSISGQLFLVKNGAGQVYWPEFGINQIGEIQPGQGYQIFMKSEGSLIYPPND